MNPIYSKDTAFLAIQSLLENLAPCCDKEVEAKAVDNHLKEAKKLMERGEINEAMQLLKMAYTKLCQRNDLEDMCTVDGKLIVKKALVEVQICQANQLMKCRKIKEAEELLENAFEEAAPRCWMSAFNVDMAVVEVLICQGKYEEAKQCKCLKERDIWEEMPDPRIPLYKAIIHTMLEEEDLAKKYWDEFLTVTDKEKNSEEAYKKLIRQGWEKVDPYITHIPYITYIPGCNIM